jgi:hypothetical protein
MCFPETGWGDEGERRAPLAGAVKPLKRLKMAIISSWKKLAWIWVWRHIGLGLAPCPFAVGDAPAWGSRWRRLGVTMIRVTLKIAGKNRDAATRVIRHDAGQSGAHP